MTRPLSMKIIAGTDQKCRDHQITQIQETPLDEAPVAPDWMPNAHAVKLWNSLVPILLANRLLTEGSLYPLAQMCAMHGKIVQLYAAGETPPASQIATLRTLFGDFGMTPASRRKVESAADVSKGNKFAANGRRKP